MSPERLTSAAREAIEAAESIHVSAATPCKIATKVRLGNWSEAKEFVEAYGEHLAAAGFIEIPITSRHALRRGQLESENPDPFDRLIAAQAEIENLIVVTADGKFFDFPIQKIW